MNALGQCYASFSCVSWYMESKTLIQESIKKRGACEMQIKRVINELRPRNHKMYKIQKTRILWSHSEEGKYRLLLLIIQYKINGKGSTWRRGSCWQKGLEAFWDVLRDSTSKVSIDMMTSICQQDRNNSKYNFHNSKPSCFWNCEGKWESWWGRSYKEVARYQSFSIVT